MHRHFSGSFILQMHLDVIIFPFPSPYFLFGTENLVTRRSGGGLGGVQGIRNGATGIDRHPGAPEGRSGAFFFITVGGRGESGRQKAYTASLPPALPPLWMGVPTRQWRPTVLAPRTSQDEKHPIRKGWDRVSSRDGGTPPFRPKEYRHGGGGSLRRMMRSSSPPNPLWGTLFGRTPTPPRGGEGPGFAPGHGSVASGKGPARATDEARGGRTPPRRAVRWTGRGEGAIEREGWEKE